VRWKEVPPVKMRKLLFKDKDGQSIVEFALILPVLLLILFGVTEFGRAIMVTNLLNTASREGARFAAVHPSMPVDSIQVKVQNILDAANIDAKEISVQEIDIDGTAYVKVVVKTDFKVLSGGILDPFMGTYELKGTTVMRYEG
jgi:Flp pilus assembly protein TadG